ncbi:MAG: LysE family transporter [Fusobacteriaceae bacterium]
MDGMIILKVIFAGLFLGLPFGPIGIICMAKTVEEGRKYGLAAAYGAITVDLIYSIVVFFFLFAVKNQLTAHEKMFQLIVGHVIMIVGTKNFFGKITINREVVSEKNINNKEVKPKKSSIKNNFIKLFLISIPNVFNMLVIITLFTGLELFKLPAKTGIPLIIFGIIIGDAGLWFITTYIISKLREKVTDKSLIYAIKICGAGIFIFGLSMVLKAANFVLPELKNMFR